MNERQIQTQCADYLRRALPKSVRFFAVPNGGSRNVREAKNMKREGVVAGVPDMVLVRSGGVMGFIEFKAPKGRLQDSQIDWRDWCNEGRVPWALVRSLDELKATLADWQIATREVS